MDPSVKKALQNLAGIYEEGFMTDSEYDKRRKSIIDGATAVKDSQRRTAGGAAAGGNKPSSVFDRLGGGGKAGGGGARRGGGADLRSVIGKPGGIVKPGSAQARQLQGGRANDLRSRLTQALDESAPSRARSSAAKSDAPPVRRKDLPQACPW
mmetsp:Transcript_20962/g.69256  ORF Transcript_20962/g.69256 Transcript_20962/m.69256 type:complete len:153 (+) Transcript_20962:39-497(+)